ncbi:MAG: hypothetical protein RBU21_14315 [FCB group bacterium]|jgi:hypothetical protein|nr:hypothetical protein [FCB group bacterium]
MRFALAIMLAVSVIGCATAPQQSATVTHGEPIPPPPPAKAVGAPQTEAAVAALKTYTFGQSREPLAAVDELVKESLKSPADRQAVAAQLAALLGSDATLEAKRYACKKLQVAGSAENVPAIAPLLLDEKTADMARYALEPMQGPEAEQALIEALPKAPDTAKVGILNSLGVRKSAAAQAEIQKLTQSANPAVAGAAKAALTRIGS